MGPPPRSPAHRDTVSTARGVVGADIAPIASGTIVLNDELQQMDLWQTEMLAGNFANAAMVYTEAGVLTVGGTSYIGRTQIEGFFAAFAPTATAVGYAITSVGTDTFSDVYDFGAAGTRQS